MKWRQGFRHPVGASLLAFSVGLAVLAALDARWAGQEVWLLVWGLAIYASVAGYVALRDREVRPATAALLTPTSVTGGAVPSLNLAPMVEQALRNLGNPGVLAANGMIAQLALTLTEAQHRSGRQAEATPLEKAQLLRSVLEASIEKLRPNSGQRSPSEMELLQFNILHEHYIDGRPIAYTVTRHNVAESTVYRGRRQAIDAVAADLAAQETSLSDHS